MVGEAIRLERLRRHWSRAKLAEKIGWHESKLSHLERNERALKVEELDIFCRAFNMTHEELLQAAKEAQVQVSKLKEEEALAAENQY